MTEMTDMKDNASQIVMSHQPSLLTEINDVINGVDMTSKQVFVCCVCKNPIGRQDKVRLALFSSKKSILVLGLMPQEKMVHTLASPFWIWVFPELPPKRASLDIPVCVARGPFCRKCETQVFSIMYKKVFHSVPSREKGKDCL
jgi:hypothetical protein